MSFIGKLRTTLTKGDREIRILAVAASLFLATLALQPVSCYVEHKDTHREVDYTRYDAAAPKPLVGLALAAHNLEAYLHDTWNRYARDRMSSKWAVDEFHYFIENNPYNERKLANEGGSDWTRPYLGIFERALIPAKDKLYTFAPAVAQLDLAADRISASWRHTSHRNTRTETYPCGSKPVRICTRTVCVSTDHTFTLDHQALGAGLQNAIAAWRSFPFPREQEPIGKFIRPLSEAQGKTVFDSWRRSPFVADYEVFLADISAADEGLQESRIVPLVAGYERVFRTNNPFCGPPLRYPEGWQGKERVLGHLRATVIVYQGIRKALTTLMNVSKAIHTAMSQIERGEGEAGMRALADLGWTVHNQNSDTKRYSHAAVMWLLVGMWVIVAGGVAAMLYLVAMRFSHTKFVRDIMTKYDTAEETAKDKSGKSRLPDPSWYTKRTY